MILETSMCYHDSSFHAKIEKHHCVHHFVCELVKRSEESCSWLAVSSLMLETALAQFMIIFLSKYMYD